MTSTLIIGLVFTAILVVFLIVSFFLKGKLEPSQYNTLHFLTALCAGFAGGFLTGDALLKIDGSITNGVKFGISGTAGFAMFFLIWLTYPKRTPPSPKDAFHFSIPSGWTFAQAVQGIAQAKNSATSFINFNDAELKLILNEYELHEKSSLEAINKLKTLNTNIPDFTVEFTNNTFTIKKN